ncbi:MAG: hypothetical protein H6667_13145 [Ardenticatenaceae bacterium]|nr:hypothetical protein [Ardenticatenaceae bacterium]MCB9442690.1 hypothetical protein [Ardenticatenaceae bacterium]
MNDYDRERETNILEALRDGLDEAQETAVVAPAMPLWQRIKIKYSGFRRYRIMLVRGLVILMALVIMGQLIVQGITAVNQYDGGPIPLPAALQQIEDDLPPPPSAPPIH